MTKARKHPGFSTTRDSQARGCPVERRTHDQLVLDGDVQLVCLASNRVNLYLAQEHWLDIRFLDTLELQLRRPNIQETSAIGKLISMGSPG